MDWSWAASGIGCSFAMAAVPASAQSAAITVGAKRIGTSDFCRVTLGLAVYRFMARVSIAPLGGEHMIDREMDIQTADGAMNTFVTHPEEGGPHPVVLFYMDAPGTRAALHDIARRLGSVGYFIVLPNLYY